MIKQTLKQSLKIIWRHPSLWFLGFLTTLFFFSTNEFLLIFVFSSLSFKSPLSTSLESLEESTKIIPPIFLVLFLFIFIILILLSVYSEILLFFLVKKIQEGGEQLASIKNSFKYLWKVFGLRLAEFLFFLILIIAVYSFLGRLPSPLTLIILLLLSVITLLVLFVTRYAVFYLLLEQKNLLLSIKNAFLFLKKHWFETIKMSFLLFFIIFFYGFVSLSFLEGGVFSYPLRVLNLVLSPLLGNYGFWFTAILSSFFTIILQIIITGLVAAYQLVCWVVFFLKNRGNIVDNILDKGE